MDNLTKSIKSILDPRGGWNLSRDAILELLEMDIRDVYPLIVNSKDPMVDFSTSEYSRENTGALISLLECLGFQGAANEFWYSGLWIPYTVQVELQEYLIREISAAAGGHRIDYDTFLAMFNTFSDFIRATSCYLDEFFSKDALVHSAVEKLLGAHPETEYETAELTLKLLASELLRRELILFRNFFTGLFVKMKAFLIAEGRIEPEFERSSHSRGAESAEEQELRKVGKAACKLFGYNRGQSMEKQDLKQRYKQLMKQYHPDVNPKGLEMAKKINRAYGLLVSYGGNSAF